MARKYHYEQTVARTEGNNEVREAQTEYMNAFEKYRQDAKSTQGDGTSSEDYSKYDEIRDELESARLKYEKVECEKGVAKVSVVGAGMMSNPGVAAKMFECLYNSNINIKMISTSEIRVTVLIEEKEVEKAMNAAHDIFGLDD